MAKTKDFVLNCTSRSFVLLLDLVSNKVEELSSDLELLDLVPKENKVFLEYQDILNKLKNLL